MCLRRLYFVREPFDQIFFDNAVGGSEEYKDVRDEVALVIVEMVVPVMEVLGEVHLLGSPE
jgi:hypothetical protein